MRVRSSMVVALAVLSMGVAQPSFGQDTPAVPLDPVAAIVEAFDSHEIVALDEGAHTNEQGHAFRLSLIRDHRFTAVVNDIVVEFGNALTGPLRPFQVLRESDRPRPITSPQPVQRRPGPSTVDRI
ncbi:MAG: hypothetical protein MK486_17055 [Gemmatimonadetes bacterium]|nr:hypothetical protein [Gemmatimonadota bacterium]